MNSETRDLQTEARWIPTPPPMTEQIIRMDQVSQPNKLFYIYVWEIQPNTVVLYRHLLVTCDHIWVEVVWALGAVDSNYLSLVITVS